MNLALVLVLVLVSALLQALFVGSEMALTAIDRDRLVRAINQGDSSRTHRAILAFLDEPTWVLGTTLLMVNACLAASASLLVWGLWEPLGPHAGWLVLALLPLTLLVGEILPKSYFQAHPFTWASRFIWPLKMLATLCKPLLTVMAWASRLIVGPSNQRRRQPFVLREELKLRIEDQASTPELGPLEREMITRIFDFGEISVEDVMVSLSDVQAVDQQQPLLSAVEELVDRGYSRLPVYQDRIDNIVGVLYAFDVLYEKDLERQIAEFMRSPYYVPESMPISQLLLELQRRHLGMAVVVDEYGGAVGVISLEDVLEEIVGDIKDEYDQKAQKWRRVGPDEFYVDARLELEELETLTGVAVPEGDYETVAGLLLGSLGHIPTVGETHHHGPLTFTVRKASDRAIREIAVTVRRR